MYQGWCQTFWLPRDSAFELHDVIWARLQCGSIQALLRHKSAGTTERYLKTLGLEHIRDAVEGLSAMGSMATSGGEQKDRPECRH